MNSNKIKSLRIAELACIVFPLLSFYIALVTEDLYVTYSVVPITIIVVGILFYFRAKHQKGV